MSAVVSSSPQGLARLSVADALALLAEVVAPTLAKGVLIRRPWVVTLAGRLDLNGRAVRRLQKLRARYGTGPLLVRIPGRPLAVLLAAADIHRALRDEPGPFAPATLEKHAALAKFEPKASLATRGPERAERKRFNDDVLESGRRTHSMFDALAPAVAAEVEALLAEAGPELDWGTWTTGWHRMARRIVLGAAAREDHELTDMLAKLRGAGNWSFAHPGRPALLRRFQERLAAHLARAEPGSLAARIAARANTAETAPVDQVTHWLFALDASGIATFRALALLAAHPEAAARARSEMAGPESPAANDFLRACLLESVRLWPTTPVILRETTADVPWPGGVMPKGTHVLVFVPFLHRDAETLPEADRFAPELWLGEPHSALIPFSEGPGTCPAHRFVPALGSLFLAALLRQRRVELRDPGRLRPDRPLPGTLDPFSLRFGLAAAH